jgi:glycosyltransferase involved in cell wall biosynthesis
MSKNIVENSRKKILIICNYYLPGFKSGGSLRTIVNMIERLGDEFDFKIITFDHDGDKIRYKNIEVNKWKQRGKAQVLYLSQNTLNISKLRELIIETRADSIYINSVFSKLSFFVLVLKKLNLIPEIKIVLAPEGELSVGALQLKAKKKNLFLKAARLTGLFDQLIWKTTSELEKKEVENLTSKYEKIFIAPNMPAGILLENYKQDAKPPKDKENTRMVFLSRYMRKKNLKWFIELLTDIKQPLTLDIYGPIEDKNYWQESLAIIQRLPSNIKVNYAGSISHNEVVSTLFKYHYFILPTLGENFGHVFIEALSAGCPIIISDRTPWLNLYEKSVGWDLPLEEPDKWLEVIRECINADQVKYNNISSKARSFAVEWLSDKKVKEATYEVLSYSVCAT